MPRFCPKCGKPIKKNEIFCKDCLDTSINVKPPKLTICPTCGKVLIKNTWAKKDVKKIIKKQLEKQINGDFEIKINDKLNELTLIKDNDTFLVPIEVKKVQCKICSSKGSKSFQAILQIRGNKEQCKFYLHYIHNELKKYENKGVFITDIKELRNGFDVYVSNQTYARNLGNKLLNEFGGVLKISEKLFSRNKQTSKDLYRLNVLYHLPLFKKNDIISLNGNPIKIINVGKRVKGFDIIKQKIVSLDYSNKKIAINKVYNTIVSKTHPQIEVINPKTFQSVALENQKNNIQNSKKLKINDKVNVIMFNKKIYLV